MLFCKNTLNRTLFRWMFGDKAVFLEARKFTTFLEPDLTHQQIPTYKPDAHSKSDAVTDCFLRIY